MQTFLPIGPPESGPAPSVSNLNTSAATAWWVQQLDLLLGQITDFANYVDGGGEYEPRQQIETVLSLEQLGRRVSGVLSNDRDKATQRALCFDALDTLEGLDLVNFEHACTLSHAERVLKDLESVIPNDAGDLLLPPARRSVEALRAVPQGFFMTGHMKAGGMELPDRRGNLQVRPLEEAAAIYLRILRNGHHGFTPGPGHETRQRQILMSALNRTGFDGGSLSLIPQAARA
ncbi:MAG TPA: hypothetical protein VKT78_17010 [Fimbriimonadaceae bacterium]|nr:hypothetical protein [Fimbriimonadaceae bacterium]